MMCYAMSISCKQENVKKLHQGSQSGCLVLTLVELNRDHIYSRSIIVVAPLEPSSSENCISGDTSDHFH